MKTKFGAPVLQVKEFGDDGFFAGYGAVFGNRDSHGDIISRGASSKSIAQHEARGSRPKMFWQHDMSKPIGKWLSFEEDDIGLRMEGKLNMNVQQGREAYHLLKDEDIDGLSIGYQTFKEEQKSDGNHLLELGLVETSVVSLGSNDRALVSAVKQTEEFRARLAAGDRLTEREWEGLLKDAFDLSNAEAERVVRVHDLRIGQGEPDKPETDDPMQAFWAAIANAPVIDETGE